jgi:SHS2 domain-containing protein
VKVTDPWPDTRDGDVAAEVARWETEGGAVEKAENREAVAWFEDHTGEITLMVRATTLADLFAKGGEALAGLMLGNLDARGVETAHETVTLRAADRSGLLVAWLDELIYRAEIAKVVFTRFDVRVASDHELAADIHGAAPTSFRNPVKAATYHRLAVEQQADGSYFARIVLDV